MASLVLSQSGGTTDALWDSSLHFWLSGNGLGHGKVHPAHFMTLSAHFYLCIPGLFPITVPWRIVLSTSNLATRPERWSFFCSLMSIAPHNAPCMRRVLTVKLI